MADTNSKPSSSVKLVLLGEAAVGKSSLVLRFVSSEFHPSKEPTIGAAFLTKKLTLPSRTIKFEIWDTAGQERFASLAPMYYRNAQAALVVYDLTKPSSLTKAKHWVAELQRQASPGIVIGFVGNKADLCDEGEQEDGEGREDEEGDGEDGQGTGIGGSKVGSGDARRVSKRDGKAFADEEGLLFFETSAKSGVNVNEVFTAIANAIPETSLKGPRGSVTKPSAGEQTGQSKGNVTLNGRSDAEPAKGCAC